ncbi:Mdm33 family-domain-containing protein [Xylaria cf. heliscus]|nr:Mdm33 family-domain-containing protein [Xylaria cf. heliscus]
MSTPRAVRPLVGVGSRLIVDQFVPRSAATTSTTGLAGMMLKRLFRGNAAAASTASAASAASTQPLPPFLICWRCRHGYPSSRQQLRFSSSTSKPPNESKNSESEAHTPLSPFASSASSSSSSTSPSSHSAATNAADATDATDATDSASRKASIDLPRPEQAQDGSAPQPQPPPPPPSTSDLDLPSAQNSRRSALNQSLSSFMDRAQTTLFTASQRINDLTGYSSIESLKSQISGLESELHAAQSHLTASRIAYKSAVSDRAATQREVTTLLARQKTWTPVDFERFTTLYRQDYELEASVGARAIDLEQAERDAERLGRELGAGILARYHEEQIWSDKIRRMSTWGTWGLMGMNILLFLLLQFGAEPWRRRRLVRGFEEKVREALAEERTAREAAARITLEAAATAAASPTPTADVEESAESAKGEEEPVFIEEPDVAAPEPDTTPPPSPILEPTHDNVPRLSWREVLENPLKELEYWRSAFLDLISDRQIALRMRDISLIAVEGLVTGVAIATTLALLLLRRA